MTEPTEALQAAGHHLARSQTERAHGAAGRSALRLAARLLDRDRHGASVAGHAHKSDRARRKCLDAQAGVSNTKDMDINDGQTPHEKYLAAVARARDAEDRNLSIRTRNKRWRAVFAAEDAMKAAAGGWA